MGMAETARLAVRIDLGGNALTGIDKLTRKVNTLGGATKRVGRGVGQLGAGLGRAGLLVGGAAVAGLGAAAKAAISFEDAFAGVRKTVDASDPELLALAGAFRKMATEIPIAADEFARIGELGGALGIPVKDLEAFTRTVALLGVTTDVSTEDAATALGQLSNVMKLTGDDYDNFASTLVDLGNKGASTESDILEIARRAGGAATLLDIAADATLGWSSAIANLGLQPELAGTALQTFYTKTLSLVSKGGGSLEAIAEIAGTSAKKFKVAFDKDASGALEDFIQGLGKLPKDKRLKAVEALFGKRSGLTRALLGLAASYDDNLAPAIDNASDAWEKNAALTEESQKRFDTIRSKITLLKNNLIEAGITLGEGFAPAIGRAAVKLSEFLRQDANRSALKSLGEDIGKAIDDIDWQKVLDGAKDFVSVMRGALDFTLQILNAINKLPTEIKAAAAGLLVLNKASGGLVGAGVGNIVGGLAEAVVRSLGTKLPGIGKLFAQPVFVTNWPLGFGPGGPGGAAGGGVGGLLKVVIPAAALVTALTAVQTQLIEPVLQEQAGANVGGTEALIKSGDAAALQQSIDGLRKMPDQLNPIQRVLYDLNANGVKTHTEGLIAAMEQALKNLPRSDIPSNERGRMVNPDRKDDGSRGSNIAVPGALNDLTSLTKSKLAEVALQVQRKGEQTIEATAKVEDAATETKRETTRGAQAVAASTRVGASSVVAAIYANRPIITTNVHVNATTVSKEVSVNGRYGPPAGSRHAPGTGPVP